MEENLKTVMTTTTRRFHFGFNDIEIWVADVMKVPRSGVNVTYEITYDGKINEPMTECDVLTVKVTVVKVQTGPDSCNK